jgi:NAD(P)H-flavin reductase
MSRLEIASPRIEGAPRIGPRDDASSVPAVWRVRSRRRETHDTFTLVLEPPATGRPFRYAPGQFNMLYQFGVGEVPISISGDPANETQLVHTIRAVGAVTRSMGRLGPGSALGIRGPFGTQWPVDVARGGDVVIVAGGIGLAPLRPALYHILNHRNEYGRVALIYGARTPEDLLYGRELERWRGRLDLDVDVTVDAAGERWRGNVGLVTTLLPRLRIDPDHAVVMICGPEIMMRFTALELLSLGLSESALYLSMERNMQCGLGYCGHCQLGPTFVCKDGPVFTYPQIVRLLSQREV